MTAARRSVHRAGSAFIRTIYCPWLLKWTPSGFNVKSRRLRDEWWLVVRIWRGRRSEPEQARAMVSEHGSHAALHVLRSKREAKEFLSSLSVE